MIARLSIVLSCLLVAGLFAGCSSGGSSGRDAALPVGADASGGSGPDTPLSTGADAGGGFGNLCGDGGVSVPLCASAAGAASVTDLSGTWVLETIGAQTVTAPTYANPFHIKSIGVILIQVIQTGNDVTLAGNYCDRVEQDDPNDPAQVVIPDAWRLTPWPVQRSGSFAPDESGQLTLTLPTLIEVVGARLANPACDALPTDPNDPRLVDDDNDGLPGITIGLKGLISGTLQCVQRQATALHGVVVAADRVEGGMVYESEQSVVESEPADLKSLYELSTSSTDPTACSSSFVMVKVPDATDAGVVDCDWVRDNEVALLGM